MINKLFDKIKENNILNYLIIFIITIFICIPLLNSNLDITKDDGIQHIYRFTGTANSIKENLLFPQIMSNFCNGFGYSWNIFYSPLTAFLPIVFNIITNSYITILKMFMFFLMLFSGISMNKLVWKITKSRKASLLSAITYIVAPYHLTDMYSRIAIAELASFVFLPIVFCGLYDLFKQQSKDSYYLAIGMSGLILTHNIITLYTVIFCFIYALIHIRKVVLSNAKEVIKKLVINILITMLITSFYWIPLLEHYFATDYEVFQNERMYNTTDIIKQKLTLKELIYEPKYGNLIFTILPSIIGIVAFYKVRKSSKHKKIMQIFLSFGIISTIMASVIFPFEYLPNIFKMIQFPWRMIEFSNFFFAVVTGIAVVESCENKRKNESIIIPIVLLLTCGISVMGLREITSYTDYSKVDKSFSIPVKVEEWTKRKHAGCASFEYLPTKAYKNYSYIVTRTKEAIITKGEANLGKFIKNNGIGNVDIIKLNQGTIIELPYIYYLGYEITLINNEQKEVLKYNESKNGFIEINLLNDIENSKLQVKYAGTILTKISYIMSLLGIIILVVILVKPNKLIK